MSTPTPTPGPAPTPAPAPAASSNLMNRVWESFKTHVEPKLREAKAEAEKLATGTEALVTEAIKLETLAQNADPALKQQLEASAAKLREIAQFLPEVVAVIAAL